MASLKASLVLSTYQAGKVILFSPKPDGSGFWQFPRTFDKPMGIAIRGDQLAIATTHTIATLENSRSLAANYPRKPDTYDSLFLPRAGYRTGHLDIHDLAFSPSSHGIIAVNTLFSCLCRIDGTHSFVPIWQPPFVTELTPDDRCHLNGMALDSAGEPTLVTALGKTNTPQGWREKLYTGGVVVDVRSGETIAGELPMPHSPRIYDGQILLLLSATGEIVRLDKDAGKSATITKLPGFARGLARCGDYLFAGISRLRPNHRFGHLPIAKLKPFCGVVVVHLPTGAITGALEFVNSCEEIYDVQILHDLGRPAIAPEDDPFVAESLTLPGRTFLGRAK